MLPHPVTVADAILIADTLIASDGVAVRVVRLPASNTPLARIHLALSLIEKVAYKHDNQLSELDQNGLPLGPCDLPSAVAIG